MDNREKERQEYLRQKGIAITLTVICAGVTLVLAVMTSVYIGLAGTRDWSSAWGVQTGINFISWTLVAAVAAFFAWRLSQKTAKRVRSIPYVPPLHEQISNLPATEILLRGSEHPPTSPDQLLRAATMGRATPVGELLRATNRDNDQTDRRTGGDTG